MMLEMTKGPTAFRYIRREMVGGLVTHYHPEEKDHVSFSPISPLRGLRHRGKKPF